MSLARFEASSISGWFYYSSELNSALNYRLIDKKLSVGAQLVVEYETAWESEFDAEGNELQTESVHSTQVLLGPSVLFRPTKNIYVRATPLFGLTSESLVVEAYFLVRQSGCG